MAAIDHVLAILRGRKEFDAGAGVWHVYDGVGGELADPGGVLLRGLHGWLLRQATIASAVPSVVVAPSGHVIGTWRLPVRQRPREEDEALLLLMRLAA